MKDTRDSWHKYFMEIARQVSTRATCDRKHVGAVIVREHTIIATGYNGSIRNAPHCTQGGHLMEDGHCVRTVHAEMNAIAQAAYNGASIRNSTIYCTALPCWSCFKVLCNAGVSRIIYDEAYRAGDHLLRVIEYAKYVGIEVKELNDEGRLTDAPASF